MTVASNGKDFDLIAPDEALARHAETDSQQARIVKLNFFGGLSPKIFLPTSKVVYNLLADTLIISALNRSANLELETDLQ